MHGGLGLLSTVPTVDWALLGFGESIKDQEMLRPSPAACLQTRLASRQGRSVVLRIRMKESRYSVRLFDMLCLRVPLMQMVFCKSTHVDVR